MAAGVTTESTWPQGEMATMCPISKSRGSWNTVGYLHVGIQAQPKIARTPEFFERSAGFLYEITLFCNHGD